MKYNPNHIVLIFALLLSLLAGPALSHPGGLDITGGLHNWKTGEYHYLQKNIRQPKNTSPSPTFSLLSESERDRAIDEYFRTANEGVGALDCDVTTHDRASRGGSGIETATNA